MVTGAQASLRMAPRPPPARPGAAQAGNPTAGRAVLNHRGPDARAGSTDGWRDRPRAALFARPRRSPDGERPGARGRDRCCPEGGRRAVRPKAGRPTRRRVPVPAVRIRDEGLDCGAAAGVVFEIENEQVGGP